MAFGDESDFLIKVEVDYSDVEKFKDAAADLARTLEKSNFWEPLDRAAESAQDAGREVEGAGRRAQAAGGGFSALGAAVVVANQAFELIEKGIRLARAGLEQMFSTLDRARELEGLSQSFNNLQQTIGAVGEDSIEGLRNSTQGLISDFELFKAANNAVVLNVVRTSDEMNKLAEIAITLGRATGRDAVQAINDLSLGIGRQSRLILDNLGIIIKQEQVYKNLAATLKTTVENLTDAQKAEAFRTAALEQAARVADQLSKVQDTAAISSSRLATSATNLADRFALSFSNSQDLAEALGGLSDTIDGIDVVTLGQQLGDLAASFINLARSGIDIAVRAIDKFQLSLGVLSKLIDNPKAFIFKADYDIAISEATKEQAQSRAKELNDTFVDAFERVQAGQKILFETNIGEESAPFLAQLSSAARAANSALEAGAEATDEQRGALTDLNVVLGLIRPQFAAFQQNLKGTEEGANRGKAAIDKLANAAANAAARLSTIVTTQSGLNSFVAPVEQLVEAFKAGTISAGEFDKQLASLAKTAASQGKKAVLEFSAATQELGEEFKSQADELKKYKKALEDLGNTTPETSTALKEAEKSAELLGKAFKAGIIDAQDLQAELKKLGEAATTSSEDVDKLKVALDKGLNNDDLGVDKLTSGLFGPDGFFPLLSKESERAGVSLEQLEGQFANLEFADSLVTGLASSIPNALQTLSSDISSQEKFDELASSIGGTIGAALGTAVLPGVGTAIGGAIGTLAGDVIGDIGSSTKKTFERSAELILGFLTFGIGNLIDEFSQAAFGVDLLSDFGVQAAEFFGKTSDEAEIARQGVASFFNDLQKESKFKPIFFGQDGPFDVDKADFRILQTTLEDGTELATSGIQQKLEELAIPETLFQDFLNLGNAFGAIFEVGGTDLAGIAGQIGQVLALNLQDPLGLNDLQLLLQKAGLSAEELGKQLEEAYFNGDIAAGEFLTSTASINDLFAEGIPGATGAASVAFENFGFTALQSGQNAQDGLRDIGAEFLEAINQLPEFIGFQVDPNSEASLQQLGQVLIQQGADAQQVAVFLQVLEQQGIRTVEQLKSLDIPQTAAIVAKLEEVGFGFQEIGADVDATIEKIKNFRAEATKEIVTKYRIQVSVEGDSIPSGAADPAPRFEGQSV